MPEPERVLYRKEGPVAVISLNRPQVRNAQDSQLLYELDERLHEAAVDDDVKAVVLRGEGKAFSAGHDLRGLDTNVSFPRRTNWADHVGKPPAERMWYREQEVYLEFCRRWRDLPKPTIAAVQGACVAGGLMLAWCCDLIIAADDAFFSDPVINMGMPGVEWFAHPWQMGPRFAKEFLFLGERVDARQARELGMVNRVVPRAELDTTALELAAKIAEKPGIGLMLVKQAINFAEDQMGLRAGVDYAFGLHHLGHAHNQIVSGQSMLVRSVEGMKAKE